MKRIFHPYQIWEDFNSGMWRTVSGKDRDQYLDLAIEFTGNAEIYGAAMLLVIEQWPITCEHNLTDLNQNRKAWIGHAATCLAIGAPEDITRKAWHALNLEQQEAANLKAKEAIQLWEERHERKNNPICEEMGAAGISKRDTGFSAADLRSFWQSSFLPENLHGDTQE